ncbi:hypothetical protein ACOYR1_15365 [Thalassotalea piscium]
MNPHGAASTEWNDDLLIVTLQGPFNELGAEISIALIRNAVINQHKKVWCKLEFWDDETLGSPCVMGLVEKASKWYVDNGCFASAVVVSNSLQQQIISKLSNGRTATFYQQADAINWLNEQRP